MWKETSATEPPKTAASAATAKPVTEDELHAILDRLEAARDIFRQNRELREVLSRLARGFAPPRRRGPGIAEAQRGVGRDHAGIRANAVERGNQNGIGDKE